MVVRLDCEAQGIRIRRQGLETRVKKQNTLITSPHRNPTPNPNPPPPPNPQPPSHNVAPNEYMFFFRMSAKSGFVADREGGRRGFRDENRVLGRKEIHTYNACVREQRGRIGSALAGRRNALEDAGGELGGLVHRRGRGGAELEVTMWMLRGKQVLKPVSRLWNMLDWEISRWLF